MRARRLFFQTSSGTVQFPLRLTPKGAKNKIGDLVQDADGNWILKASVTAVPENGKANTALIKMLAKSWKLPKSSLSVVSGATDRNKVIEIATDDGNDLIQRLERLMSS